MRGSDGFRIRSERPAITLVCFGRIDDDLRNTLCESLQAFIEAVQDGLPVRPELSCRIEPDPEKIPPVNQERAFYPALKTCDSGIVLGVTNIGFYSPSRSRFIFGYGSFDGLGVLSTYRFRTETPNRSLFRERMGKQILKTLAMACNLSACRDEGCVVSYHRHVGDLDHNRYLCRPCREELVRGLAFFLGNDPTNDPEKGVTI